MAVSLGSGGEGRAPRPLEANVQSPFYEASLVNPLASQLFILLKQSVVKRLGG